MWRTFSWCDKKDVIIMTTADDKRQACKEISNGFFEISRRTYQWWADMELYKGFCKEFPDVELTLSPESLSALYYDHAEKYEKAARKFQKLSKSKIAIYLTKQETIQEELSRVRRIERVRKSAM